MSTSSDENVKPRPHEDSENRKSNLRASLLKLINEFAGPHRPRLEVELRRLL